MTDAVAAFRAFNRFHTRFVGALQPDFMGSALGLTAARIVYEIAQEDGVLASALQERLGLDAGYVSRVLRSFEKRGWIVRDRGSDARRRPIRLTAQGIEIFEAIDSRTRSDVAQSLEHLSDNGRTQLVEALGKVQSLLQGKKDAPAWRIRTFQTGDLPLIASRQSILYARDYGWGRPMEVLQSEVTTEFLRNFQEGREQCWVAETGGTADPRMLGAVMLVDVGGGSAKLRLLHVEPEARGLGIGATLVDACLDFARAVGYVRVELWTHTVLASARRIYQAAGFRLTAIETHDRFGSPVQGEIWELSLEPEN